MLARAPLRWNALPGGVEPAWQFLWRDMSLAMPFWLNGRAPQDLVERIDLGSLVNAGVFNPAPEGIAYNSNGTTFYLRTTASHQEYSLTRNGAWTVFWACRFDGLQSNIPPVRFGDGTIQAGHWEMGFNRISGAFRSVRFRFGGTPGNFFSRWDLATEIPAGYHTFCLSMPADRQSLRFYLDGVDQGVATQNDTADSYAPLAANTEFRLSWPSGNRVNNYALFVSRDAFVTESQAAALHNDPWAWVRPASVSPAIFVDMGAGGGISGTAAAETGPASVSASGAHGVSGSANASSGAAQVQASGSIVSPVSGTAAAETGPATTSATGVLPISGAVAAVAPAAIAGASGTLNPGEEGHRRAAVGSVGVFGRNSQFI